jgi:hypothetical protein
LTERGSDTQTRLDTPQFERKTGVWPGNWLAEHAVGEKIAKKSPPPYEHEFKWEIPIQITFDPATFETQNQITPRQEQACFQSLSMVFGNNRPNRIGWSRGLFSRHLVAQVARPID